MLQASKPVKEKYKVKNPTINRGKIAAGEKMWGKKNNKPQTKKKTNKNKQPSKKALFGKKEKEKFEYPGAAAVTWSVNFEVTPLEKIRIVTIIQTPPPPFQAKSLILGANDKPVGNKWMRCPYAEALDA